MINFAPSLISDELLCSYAARWQFLSGLSQETFCNAVAGRQVRFHALNAARFVPIESTSGRLAGISWVEENMTLYPFARPFLGEVTNARHFTYGLNRKRLGTEVKELLRRPWRTVRLKHCPECVRENRLIDGVAVWRRSHNLPGVTACINHGIKLIERPHVPRSLEILQSQSNSDPCLSACVAELWYAKAANELLVAGLPIIHRLQFKLALHAGLIRTFGQREIREMRALVVTKLETGFDPEFLLLCGLGEFEMKEAVSVVLQKDKKPLNPVHAILIAKFSHIGGIVELFQEALTFKVKPISKSMSTKLTRQEKRDACWKAVMARFKEKRQCALTR